MLFRENLHYGHAEILLDHCRLPNSTRIPHRVQHGWQPGPGMSDKHMAEPGKKIVWSSRNLRSSLDRGFSGATPIGAPFLYLPALEAAPPSSEKSVLAIPFHGWERGELHGSVVAYADSLASLRKEGFGDITVCMYWFEYEQAALRALFESRGMTTITMGNRGENPEFLHRQRQLIRQHSVVTSNRVSTATFYALSLGVPFFLWGPVQGIEGSDDPTGERFDAWQQQTFPELRFDAFSGECHQEIGMRELGAEFVQTPETLRETLNVGPGQRGARTIAQSRRYLHAIHRSLTGTP